METKKKRVLCFNLIYLLLNNECVAQNALCVRYLVVGFRMHVSVSTSYTISASNSSDL